MLLFGLTPAAALAHEKWFTSPAVHSPDWSLVLSGRTVLALAVGLAAVAFFAAVERLIGDPEWPRLPFFARMARGDMTLLSVQTSITLIYMGAGLALFAPQLALPPALLGYTLAGLQIAIAFTFITSLFDRIGAAVLLALGLVVVLMFSPLDLLQQAQYAGIAIAVLLIGSHAHAAQPRPPSTRAWGRWGVVALRVFAGIAFLSVALADKVWNPEMSKAFLAEYPHFNVLRYFGIADVSDATFGLIAGAVEAAIGLLLIFGYLTRVVILVMLLPFNVTVPLLPAVEMIGHLPIFGLMYVLLVHGSGRTPLEPRDELFSTGKPPPQAVA